jgi:signal transduction histidine kinase
VKDNGPGIPREYHEKIFDRFFRVDKARSRAHGGAGLGLAIAKQAVERNGGRIILEDNAPGGSVFRIQFEA